MRRRWRRLRARSRLRSVNRRRVTAALRRPPPDAPALPVASGIPTTYGAPRTLLYVTVRRDNPGWRDLYGHWWVEVGEESYGWWPDTVPLRALDVLRGTGGVLNGQGLLGHTGTRFRDARHGSPAPHAFHPVLTRPLSEQEVHLAVRAYAHGYQGVWRWRVRRGRGASTCQAFQDGLLSAVGLVEGVQYLHTRGRGCPFLYRPRTVLWRLQDHWDRLAERPRGRSPAGSRLLTAVRPRRPRRA